MKKLKKVLCFALLFATLTPNISQVATVVNEEVITDASPLCDMPPYVI